MKMAVGKYKGEDLVVILEKDRDYFFWLDSLPLIADSLKEEIELLKKLEAEEPCQNPS